MEKIGKKNGKKKNAGIACMVAAVFAFFGCEKQAPPLTSLKLATGGVTGTYYAYGSALGTLFQQKLGLKVTVTPTAAAVANIGLVQAGSADFAFVQNDVMTYAYNGTNIFASEGAQKDFSAVAGLYPEVCHIVAVGDVADIGDLRGRRVSVGEGGSGTSLNAAQILEAYGMSFADIKPEHLSFGDSAKALAAGEIDAFFCTAGTPTPAVADLAGTVKIRLLSVSAARTKWLIGEYPYYAENTVPAGTYPGVDVDTHTVAVRATLVVHNKIQKSDVYKITKALFESKAGLAAVHPKGADLGLEAAVLGIPIPFHPGALQYYREKGVIK
ncbi:MAG: TAXI family TRAP transporter solute-binding subunit [Spirochaetaceae bacterium]|nr:TAXI family TRAP transporter solute-binding subunit [Spirochaetaceae bacterium]